MKQICRAWLLVGLSLGWLVKDQSKEVIKIPLYVAQLTVNPIFGKRKVVHIFPIVGSATHSSIVDDCWKAMGPSLVPWGTPANKGKKSDKVWL